MQTRIRHGAPHDAGGVGNLMAQLAEHAIGTAADGDADRFCAILAQPNQTVFVAEDESGQLVGLLSIGHQLTLWHAGPSALIQELVVDKAMRRKGVGRALILAAMQWAREVGCSEIGVSTEQDNLAAQAFYQRMGFTDISLLLEHHFEECRTCAAELVIDE
jgi:GNAT superfamily N-acetyltransferase